jgi:hypothetical protein
LEEITQGDIRDFGTHGRRRRREALLSRRLELVSDKRQLERLGLRTAKFGPIDMCLKQQRTKMHVLAKATTKIDHICCFKVLELCKNTAICTRPGLKPTDQKLALKVVIIIRANTTHLGICYKEKGEDNNATKILFLIPGDRRTT